MKIIHEFVPSQAYPRHSEGAFYRRWDGNIGFVYSRFTGGKDDFSSSEIYEAVLNADGTQMLAEERVLFTAAHFHAQNIMCPSLVPMRDGRLLLFFLVRSSPGHLNPWMYESFDSGRTFVNGREIFSGDRYIAIENDKATVDQNGNIVLWVMESEKKADGYAGIGTMSCAFPLISADGGKTFTEGIHMYMCDQEKYEHGLQEPVFQQFSDGSILVLARTQAGCQYGSRSFDGGRTYTPFVPMKEFPSPLSPLSMKMLCDGRVMAVFNPRHQDAGTNSAYWARRSPLAYRTSRDGVNWSPTVILEEFSETMNYCYTAIFPQEDYVLLAYNASDMIKDGGNLNRQRIVRMSPKEIL